jgi:hypothetical protein
VWEGVKTRVGTLHHLEGIVEYSFKKLVYGSA